VGKKKGTPESLPRFYRGRAPKVHDRYTMTTATPFTFLWSLFTTKPTARQSHNKPSWDKENPQRCTWKLHHKSKDSLQGHKNHEEIESSTPQSPSLACIPWEYGTPKTLASKTSQKQSPHNNCHHALALSTWLLQTILRIQTSGARDEQWGENHKCKCKAKNHGREELGCK
jgi:hypothetical protein